jgi:hypothetical protein
MECNCKVTNAILAVIILVFLFWQTVASKWIIAVAALLLLMHAFCCRNCEACEMEKKPAKRKK